MIFTHTVSVKSLTDTTGGRRVYGTSASGIQCSIQPMNDVTASQAGYSLEKTVKIYIQQTNAIKTNDKLTDQDAIEYTVKGVKRYAYAGNVAHTEITAEVV